MSEYFEYGIQINLLKPYGQICETLERMGIVNKKEKVIYPSCYCHKNNENYYICHFKELFNLQGKPSSFDNFDKLRRATITYLLQSWGFIEVNNPEDIQKILTLHDKIDVIPHRDKHIYKIIHKFKQYSIV